MLPPNHLLARRPACSSAVLVQQAQRCCLRQRPCNQTRFLTSLIRADSNAPRQHQNQNAGVGGMGGRSLRPREAMPGQQIRQATTHAISNPVLADIEKRWEDMPPQEQANLWMSLRDRMKVDWHDLTMNEKKAAYWIAFGPHGPRTPRPADFNWRVFKEVMKYIGISAVIFALTRYFANPPPRTMNKEWQEASNAYLKKQKAEPITGYSSPDYKGKGLIQSPLGKTPKPMEE